MPLTSICWLLIVSAGFFGCLFSDPFWGLLTYLFIYFLSPSPDINWWGNSIPALRWSLIAAVVVLAGGFLNSSKLNRIGLKKISPGKWLILFLVISILISVSVAVDPTRSLERCYDFFRYLIIYYLIIKCMKDEKQLKLLLLFILLCGLFLGYQAYNMPRHSGRLEGVGTPDTDNANHFALLLATIVPLALPLLTLPDRIIKVLVVAPLVFILNGIVLCNSRGAMLAMICSLVCIFLIIRKGKFRRNLVIFSVIGIVMFAYLADPIFWERFKTIAESPEKDKGSGRLDIWPNGLKMVPDHPFGAGGDGFIILSPKYLPVNLLDSSGRRASHNTYLLILVEQGAAGLLIYTCFFGNVIFLIHRARKSIVSDFDKDRARYPPDKSFLYISSIAVESALWGHAVGAFFGNRLYYEFYYVLAAIGTSIALMILKENEYAGRQA